VPAAAKVLVDEAHLPVDELVDHAALAHERLRDLEHARADAERDARVRVEPAHLALVLERLHGPMPACAEIDVEQHRPEVDGPARDVGERAAGDALAEVLERLVEVRDRFRELARVQEGERDALLEEHLLLRVAALAVDEEVDLRRLAEEAERLARRRRARRFVARLEEILLRLLEMLGAAEVIGEHAVEVRETIGEERLDGLRGLEMLLLPRLLQDRL